MYKDFILKNKDIDILKFRIEDSLYGDYELTILERYNINNLHVLDNSSCHISKS